MAEQIDAVDFALAAYRDDDGWQVQELGHDLVVDVETIVHALRRFPGDGGAVGEPSAAHDEASGGHDEAGGHADEGDSGVIAALKKLHPATIHFPIALFLMAAATELFVMRRKDAGLESAVRVLVHGGAIGAVVAVLFGWIHTGLWFGGDAVMQVHRWNGMLIAVLGLAMAYLASRASASRTALRAAIFAMAALVLVQGFLGGELAHGANHLGISWL